MAKILRPMAAIILILFYIVAILSLGHLFLESGDQLFFFFLFLFTFLLLFGDRIFLVFLRAKELDRKEVFLYERLENLSCLKGVAKTRVYTTFYLPHNIYVIHPYFGTPVLIFSQKFIGEAEPEIIEEVLDKALVQIESGKLKLAHLFSFFQFSFMFPKHLFERFHLSALGVFYAYIISPLEYIKDYIVISSKEIIGTSSKREGDNMRVASFLEKLDKLDRLEREFSGIFLDLGRDFSLYEKKERGLWNTLLRKSSL